MHKGHCASVLGWRTDPVWFICGACRKAVGRCPGVSGMGRGFGAPREHFSVTEGDSDKGKTRTPGWDLETDPFLFNCGNSTT